MIQFLDTRGNNFTCIADAGSFKSYSMHVVVVIDDDVAAVAAAAVAFTNNLFFVRQIRVCPFFTLALFVTFYERKIVFFPPDIVIITAVPF